MQVPEEETVVEDTPQAEATGIVTRLVGSGQPSIDESGLQHYQKPPGLLRPFARRAYQRDLAMNSIRRGFEDLSGLMSDIRDGLDASVDRQGELLDQLKWLPTVAKQNADSAEQLEKQFTRSNDIAGENLKLQSESLRTQAESVRALRDQILGQRDQNNKLNDVLGKMGRESRDAKREVDDMQSRLDKMRESDQSIADNLGGVASAIRNVSQQTAVQGEVVAKLQSVMDERTARLVEDAARRNKGQTILLVLSLFLAMAALGAVLAIGTIYLRNEGLISF